MLRPLMTLIPAAILLAGCLGSGSLYYTEVTPKFNNMNFAYFKQNYPLMIDVKGSKDEQERDKISKYLASALSSHPKLFDADMHSAVSYQGDDKGEITYILQINSPETVTGRSICAEDLPAYQSGKSATAITDVNIAFCRNDKALSYTTAKFNKAVSYESDEFYSMLSRASQKILYRQLEDENRLICQTPPC